MKKLILFLILCLMAVPAFAEEMIEYTFHNSEYRISFPSSFIVADENADSATVEILNEANFDLFACIDDSTLIAIRVYDDAFEEVCELLTWSDAKLIGDTWSRKLETDGCNILFVDPYVSQYSYFGKVFFTETSNNVTCYSVDYVTSSNKDLIVIGVSSYGSQFDVEEDHTLNLCADTFLSNYLILEK